MRVWKIWCAALWREGPGAVFLRPPRQVSVKVASRNARRGFCFSSRNQQMGPRPDRAGEISPAPSHAVRARTLQICAQNQLDTRLLPVLRAGNAPSPARSSRPTAVHPRACGERAAWRARKSPPVGSSPRLRGTLQRLGELDRLARFIPAPAGNARAARRRAILPSVHPRACGERPNARQISSI